MEINRPVMLAVAVTNEEIKKNFMFLPQQDDNKDPKVKCLQCQLEFVYTSLQKMRAHIAGTSINGTRVGICPDNVVDKSLRDRLLSEISLDNTEQQSKKSPNSKRSFDSNGSNISGSKAKRDKTTILSSIQPMYIPQQHLQQQQSNYSQQRLTSSLLHDQDSRCLEPFQYLLQMPGKDVRGSLIDCFQTWLQIPEDKLALVKDIVGHLHTASLLVDDIEDNSRVRRGQPVAHSIFGIAQTINSANYVYFLW